MEYPIAILKRKLAEEQEFLKTCKKNQLSETILRISQLRQALSFLTE